MNKIKIKVFLILILFTGLVILPINNASAFVTCITQNYGPQDGEINSIGANSDTVSRTMRIGDLVIPHPPEYVYSLIGVNLANIPETANITAATMILFISGRDQNVWNTDPFLVDLVDFGPTIDDGTGDESGPLIITNFASFRYINNTRTMHRFPCSIAVQHAVTNNKIWSLTGSDRWFQVRIRPSQSNYDIKNDRALIATANNPTNDVHPQLIVYYTIATAPPAPNNVKATNDPLDYEMINVTWDDSAGESSYRLYRNTVRNSNTAVLITSPSANQTNYNDSSGIITNTVYYYWLKAVNSIGESPFSAAASNLAPIPAVPADPFIFAYVIPAGGNHIILKWDNVANETSYSLFMNTVNVPATSSNIGQTGKNITNFHIYDLNFSTQYYFWIKACNIAGSSAFLNWDSKMTGSLPISHIPVLNATSITYNSVKLWWNNIVNETSYVLYRNTVNDPVTSQVLTGLAADITESIDTGLQLNTTYYYWIKSFIGTNTAGFSSVASNRTGQSLNLRVYSESIFDAASGSEKSVVLEWTPPPDAVRYRIYRSSVPIKSPITPLIELNAGQSSFADTTVEYGRTYYYNVAYSRDNINYMMDIPAENFLAIVIKANDMRFNNRVELVPKYDYVKALAMSANPLITGPLISAFQPRVYRIGDLPKEVSVLDATWPDKGSVIIGYINDVTSNSMYKYYGKTWVDSGQDTSENEYEVNAMDSFLIFNMNTLVDVTHIKIISVDKGGFQPDNMKISFAENDFGPWTLVTNIASDFKKLLDGNYSVDIPVQSSRQKARFVKINPNHTGSKYRLSAVWIYYKAHVEEVTTLDRAIQDKFIINLPYSDNDNNGYPETYDGSAELPNPETTISVFFLNGKEWNYMGGEIDSVNNTIDVNSQNLGIFAIFPSTKPADKEISFTKKYLTADNDGISDCIHINIKPKKEVKVDIRIYDLIGRLIANPAKNQKISGFLSLEWCGKNSRGEELEIGPYMYEIRFDDKKKETGVILIVK